MPENPLALVADSEEDSLNGTDRGASSCCQGSPSSRLSQRAQRADGETVVSVLMAKTLAHPELISLAAGFVDTSGLPVDTTLAAVTAVLSDSGRARAALQYGTTSGHPPLRQAILDRLVTADRQTADEMGLSTDQVVVTAGSNQLLHHVGEVLLDPGDIVLCAAPSYFVFLGIIESLGATTVGVEADEHGIIPEALDATLAALEKAGQGARVKAIYVTSYFDNPAGVSVASERRPALVDIAKRHSSDHKVYLIEDMAYRELRYRGDDLPSLRCFDEDGDTVIQAGTFSKSFSPGIRIGWGILPGELVEPVLAQKGHLDFGSANFNQTLMAEVFAQGEFDPHVERLRDCYRKKMNAALEAVDDFLRPIDGVKCAAPDGGLYVWLQVPDAIDTGLAGPLFDRAVDEGVLYVPGEVCYPRAGVPVGRNGIRLSFGIQSCESIRHGVEALARAIRGIS
jgi:2-aminoadipate transaminase